MATCFWHSAASFGAVSNRGIGNGWGLAPKLGGFSHQGRDGDQKNMGWGLSALARRCGNKHVYFDGYSAIYNEPGRRNNHGLGSFVYEYSTWIAMWPVK
jgi:hypothetical protein